MSDTTTLSVPTRAWHGDVPFELNFPASWDVVQCCMEGQGAPALDEAGIRAAFAQPIGTRTIRELAQERTKAAIIFDDMTRPTNFSDLAPIVIEELKAGGIRDENIQFFMALGAYGAYTRTDFVKKLGEEIVAAYPVFNHNIYENCTLMGKTSRGTRVMVNAEVASCDLKIGMGSIVPHIMTGFGGGAKILLPGVASIETIEGNHESLRKTILQTPMAAHMGMGKYRENIQRLDMVESARIAGLDIIVNALINIKRENTALVVGDVEEAYLAGAEMAETHYATHTVEDADIVIANCYSKGSEAGLGLFVCLPLLMSDPSKDFVMINSAPEGQVTHYMYGCFGNNTGARYSEPIPSIESIPGINRMFVLSPFGDKAGEKWIYPTGREVFPAWDEILEKLKQTHGANAKVAVVPDATIQYFPEGGC